MPKISGIPRTALLDGDALHVADLLHPLDIEQTAHLAAADLLGDVAALGLTGGDVARTGQLSWPIFSSRVMRRISASTYCSIVAPAGFSTATAAPQSTMPTG